MLPIVISEQLVHSFSFYLDNQVRQGMLHENELYGLVYEFGADHRLRAYQCACELVEQKIPVVITASLERYTIWISLRSPAYSPKPTPKYQPALSAQLERCVA